MTIDSSALTVYTGAMVIGIKQMTIDDFMEIDRDGQNRYFEIYQSWCEQHGLHAALDKNFLLWLEER